MTKQVALVDREQFRRMYLRRVALLDVVDAD